MELEKLSAKLRPRGAGEAMDLGVTVLRAYFLPVFVPWLLLTVPLMAVIFWLIPGFWGMALVWWWLPVLGRLPLFVLSRAIFGDTPRPVRVLREVPKMFSRHLLWPLTVGRLSPFRAYLLPVSELEQQRGRSHSQRGRVLRSRQDSSAWGLFSMAGVVVLCVWAGLFAATASLLEIFQVSLEGQFVPDGDLAVPDWPFVELAVSMLIVEPFHVASGFALYLTRRQSLEGWDIELTFRRTANRIQGERSRSGGAAVSIFLASLFLGGLPAQGAPDSTEPRAEASSPSEPEDPQEAVKAVLGDEAFGAEVESYELQYIGGSGGFGGGWFGGGVGQLFTIGAWFVAIALAFWVLYLIFKSFFGSGGQLGDTERGPPPAEVLGRDVRPESLPDDPAAEAWRLWQAGEAAACLGLLYRASLAFLIHDRGLDIRRSATEADCVQLVRAMEEGEMFSYFRELTASWQSCAYAHRLPAESTAQYLCDRWSEFFTKRSGGRG